MLKLIANILFSAALISAFSFVAKADHHEGDANHAEEAMDSGDEMPAETTATKPAPTAEEKAATPPPAKKTAKVKKDKKKNNKG